MNGQLVTIFILLLLIGCDNQKEQQEFAFEKEIVINDPGNLDSTTVLSAIIEKVEIVPLEFSKECIIAEVKKVRFWNKNVYVQDKTNVFIFDLQGKYRNKISRLGKGPGEYARIDGFDINEETGNVYIYDNMTDKLLEYRSDGTFINEIKNKLTGLTFSANNQLFYTYMAAADNRSKYCLNIYDESGNTVKQFIEGNYYESTLGNYTVLAGTSYDGSIPFHMDLDYNIYLLENDRIKPYIKINFGRHQVDNSLKEKILTNPENSWKLLIDNDAILGINNVHILKNVIYFEYVYQMIEHNIICSKTNNKLYRNFIDDLSLLYFQEPKCQYKNKLVSVYPVSAISANIERIKSKISEGESISRQSMKTLQLLENTNVYESNPLLIFYTVK